MKKLLYVPIVHMEADLGTLAVYLDKATKGILGLERWRVHRETVSKFWDGIADYFNRIDAADLKIYQDGLAAQGSLGLKIVEEGAASGSKNHQIILSLIRRGAQIRQTEDPQLLKAEYKALANLVTSDTALRDKAELLQYRLSKQRLLAARDRFIAQRINESLQDQETAALFLGTYHNIRLALSTDIIVREVKETAKVKAYFDQLAQGRNKREFKSLVEYFIAPVDLSPTPFASPTPDPRPQTPD